MNYYGFRRIIVLKVLIASALHSFRCADRCSFFCQLCGAYFDESHSECRSHRHRVKLDPPEKDWYRVPDEAKGDPEKEAKEQLDADGYPRDLPWEMSLAADELVTSWEMGLAVPPWSQMSKHGAAFCKACGSYCDDKHLQTDRHKSRIQWESSDWHYALEGEDLPEEPQLDNPEGHEGQVFTESVRSFARGGASSSSSAAAPRRASSFGISVETGFLGRPGPAKKQRREER